MTNDEPWWHEADGGRGSAGSGSGSGSGFGTGPEEAAKLFGAVKDRLMSDPAAMKAGFQVMDMLSNLSSSVSNPAAPGDAPECAYCPLCQTITKAQGISPESVETVTAAAFNFIDAVKKAMTSDDHETSDGGIRHVPLDDDDAQPDASTDNQNPASEA